MLLRELDMFDFYNKFVVLCALFLIYSFFGWIIEVIYTFFEKKKFVNRGFLIGPLVPIWGTGAILITLILRPDDSMFNLIISSAFIGTFLEYVVNYLMEKIFKARWWDYSKLPFNVNGRVWLGSSLFFGIGGVIIVQFMNPLLFDLFKSVNPYVFRITNPYDKELQIEVLSFDKEGVLTDRDVYIDYLESSDGKNYKVIRQVHNELEDINSLHGKVR